jgi:hypothetical protein
VGPGGLELRANHAVAIEPISGPWQIGQCELPKNSPERTGNQLQKERYYRKFRAPRGALLPWIDAVQSGRFALP